MQKDELELQKLQAEITKLHAEAKGARRSSIDRISDFVKVFGAVFAALAAGYAAFETYRVTQVETRLANYEKQEAVRERDAAERELADAIARSSRARQALTSLQAAVERAQKELAAARQEPASPTLARRLNDASESLRNAAEAAPMSGRKIGFVITGTDIGRRRAEGWAATLIERGYGGTFVRVWNTFASPTTTEILFQRQQDRVVAQEISELLNTRGIRHSLRLEPFDDIHPDALGGGVGRDAQ